MKFLPATAIAAQFQPKAKRQYVPDGKNNSPKEEVSPTGDNITYNYTFYTDGSSEEGVSDFPKDYAIYVLEDTRGAPKYDSNHSESYGIAIHKANSEVVYWMEAW